MKKDQKKKIFEDSCQNSVAFVSQQFHNSTTFFKRLQKSLHFKFIVIVVIVIVIVIIIFLYYYYYYYYYYY